MMTPQQRADGVSAELALLYPDAECSLDWAGGDPWRLIVMARLSAQCTDKRVNTVSLALFERWENADAMALSEPDEVEDYVRSCGLFRTKARDIVLMSRQICERFGGKVPSGMEELLSLAGVGRKIANLVRGDAFGMPGIVSDTHCIRISARIGLTEAGCVSPERTERLLGGLIAPGGQSAFCHRMVLFGREYCMARNPRCAGCPISELCEKNLTVGDIKAHE